MDELVRGKTLSFDVIREIKRLGAEGKSINAIRASLKARGVNVGRSTISEYVKDARPKPKAEAGAKTETVAPAEKVLPRPSQPAFDREVVEWYEELRWTGKIPKEWTIYDFVNRVMTVAKEKWKEQKAEEEFGRDVLSVAVREGARALVSRVLEKREK